MFKAIIIMLLSSMLTLTLLLSGCGKKEETKSPPPAPSATAQAPQLPPAPSAEPQAPQMPPAPAPQAAAPAPAAPAPQPTQAPSVVLATTDGETAGVRVEVQQLKRSAGTVMLKFAIINDSDQSFATYKVFKGDVDNNDVGGVHLVDTANKKKYLVVRDSEKKCLCSRDMDRIKAKSRANLWAQFPEPPQDIQKVNVVIPHFIPMLDIPLGG